MPDTTAHATEPAPGAQPPGVQAPDPGLGHLGPSSIRSLIHTVRGQQVMLDSDLAALYGVETKVFNQAVNRNGSRFPDRFRFQLSVPEFEDLRSHSVTSSRGSSHGGRRYLPYVFTEQGVAMLSAVLRSERAVQVSIGIMDAFVEMRRFLASSAAMFEQIRAVDHRQAIDQRRNEERFDELFDLLEQPREPDERIFFEGQVYDALSLLANLIGSAERDVTLVDPHVDVRTLNVLAKKRPGVRATIYTRDNGRLSPDDAAAFDAQYPTLEVRHTGAFHDRFLLLDGNRAYHVGASLKDAGRKCFAVTRLRDPALVAALESALS